MVAAASATFAFTEVRIGVVPAVISAVVLPRMVPHVAHRLMLTGEVFDAATAAAGGPGRPGRCRTPTSTASCARSWSQLAAGAPTALAETKRLLRARTPTCTSTTLLELSARFFASEEGQEGIAVVPREARRPLGARPTD